MVTFFFLLKIFTCMASVVLACVIFSRDPGLRINRLMAVVPTLVVLLSLGELSWNLQSDPIVAEHVVRATAFSWMMLGPACLHIFSELAGSRSPMAGRLVPVAYLASALIFIAQYSMHWGLAGVVPVSWGYAVQIAPSFALLYATFAGPVVYVLIAGRKILSEVESSGERKVWYSLCSASVAAVVIVTSADIALPLLGVECPPLGGTGLALLAFGVDLEIRRHGHSLLSPGAFATAILESLGDGVVLLRANGEVRIANAAFERLIGGARSEVCNVAFSHFVPSLDADPGSITEPVECDLVANNGELIPVLISPTHWPNASGSVRGAAFVVRDLREVSALRVNLVASDRLAAVGGLSASIAEEIREPIAEMRSHLEGMHMHLGCLNEVAAQCESTEKLSELIGDREELLEECLEGVSRIETIVRDVRGFAVGASGPVTLVDLNELVEHALRIARAGAGVEVAVERQFDSLEPVPCVAGEIVQVLVNLLVNAIHAIDGTGRVHVSTWQHDSEVWICVEDNGYGISRDVMARIFDPFFTTKPVGDGTGLGLAISHRIVRNHGGDLRVESEQGRGARFTLVLPVGSGDADGRGTVFDLASG